MKKLTESDIEREATNRNNYLQKKSGWRGFIEGALWHQEQSIELQTDLDKAVAWVVRLKGNCEVLLPEFNIPELNDFLTEQQNKIIMPTKLEENIYEIVQKRELKEGEKIIGVACAISGKKYNLVRSGKSKLMIPQ